MMITPLSLGPMGTNCYIIAKGVEAIIVDPSGEANKIAEKLTELRVQPLAILLTHAHFDHIGALDEIREQYNIPVYLSKQEQGWLSDPERNGALLFGLGDITAKEADFFFTDTELSFGSITLSLRKTPGHSPGSVSFIFTEAESVIDGDSLFNSGIGRTDLFGGDYEQLEKSIKEELYSLPSHYTVYPGHGPKTTIQNEQASNPFVKG
ncbi:MBL fold metallo-hydrolase [Gracilibacillus phocaeensis]|uniref:MBL fold metallo-hydrolase n=1 Tax=Gracilibacillus phocaeensis TaxID=2042304 RepID=UPI001030F0E7|nr:MBL fold metallo-hydrolase [Gracilibacillus phocaeensis]